MKIRAIILIFIYTSFNVGTIINAHFCGENFDHMAVFTEPISCCDSSCCHNSSFELQIQSDYDAPESISSGLVPLVFFIQEYSVFSTQQFLEADPTTLSLEAGLFIHSGKQPIYLTNRVFLI